jgi:hypothetical protein
MNHDGLKMRLLANPQTSGFDINVDTKAGMVTLFGLPWPLGIGEVAAVIAASPIDHAPRRFFKHAMGTFRRLQLVTQRRQRRPGLHFRLNARASASVCALGLIRRRLDHHHFALALGCNRLRLNGSNGNTTPVAMATVMVGALTVPRPRTAISAASHAPTRDGGGAPMGTSTRMMRSANRLSARSVPLCRPVRQSVRVVADVRGGSGSASERRR